MKNGKAPTREQKKIASLTDEGVAQFTQLAALTGKATKSTTEEMGSLFATGYGCSSRLLLGML